MKLICSADIHLGRKSTSPIEDDFSTASAFEKLIDEALDREVDGLLLCGDIFDNKKNPFDNKKILEKQFEKLRDKNIQVIMIAGNHDTDKLEKKINLDNYPYVHLIGKDCNWEAYDLMGLQIYGFSFDQEEYEKNPFKLAKKTIKGENYILMIHGDYSANKGKYAPFHESLESEIVKNSMITLIGHIHKYDNQIEKKYINLGSLQAMDFGETGPHGYVFLEIENNKIENWEFVPFSSVYYDYEKIDVSNYPNDDLVKIISDKLLEKTKLNFYRISLEGRLSEENYDLLNKEIENEFWAEDGYIKANVYVDVEKITNNTLKNLDIEAMCQQKNAIGIVAQMLRSLNNNTFIIDYEDIFNKFKEEYNRKLHDKKHDDYHFLEDEEILTKIEKTLLNILYGVDK